MTNPKKITKETIDDWVVREPMTGCWIWMGAMNKAGYGTAKSTLAHRVVYRFFKGDFDNSLMMMHLCHTPICVNPDHLRPGTAQENTVMSVGANRWNVALRSKRQAEVLRRKTRDGLIVGRRAQFTDAQIKGIRKLVDFGIDKRLIGDSLGVTFQAINQIHKRKAYAYVC